MEAMMNIPHPIPYQGSKRNLASAILQYFPNDTQRLIEPFAGSAAVSIAAAHAGRATHFLLNDLNKPLMDLWESIINRPENLAGLYRHL
jgi:DNA adenine methylase